MSKEYDAWFGAVGQVPVNWRHLLDPTPDDDAELAVTPPDVVAMLGFDPLELEKAEDETEKAFNPDQPRDDQGQWTDSGQAGANAGLEGAEVFVPPGGLVVYHGTTTKYLEEVRTKGLMSLHARSKNNDHLLGPRGESVYVTDDLGTARTYAQSKVTGTAVEGEFRRQPLLLEITLPPEARAKKDPWVERALMVDGGIPPEWISRISTDGGKKWSGLAAKGAGAWYAVVFVDGEDEEDDTTKKYDPNQPRDDRGRWTEGGYSSASYVDNLGTLHTSNIEDAVRALGEDRKVVLSQPHQVSTLLSRLAEVAKEAEAAGQKAKLYDLCNVSVPGTNLFCAESKGIARVNMPQLSGKPTPGTKADALPKDKKGEVDLQPRFMQYLKDKGYSVSNGIERAEYLRASQSELNGVKVGGMMQAMAAGKIPDAALFVSRDDYIVDGHHRWAAKVGLSYLQDHIVTMPVQRVNTDIITLLNEAKVFAADMGIPQAAVKYLHGRYVMVLDDDGLPYVKFDKYDPMQPRDDAGRWSAEGGPPVNVHVDNTVVQNVAKAIKAAAVAIPARHQATLEKMGFTFHARPTVYSAYGEPVQGLIEYSEKRVSISAMDSHGRKLRDPTGTATHEMGHMLDSGHGFALSSKLSHAITEDAKRMKEFDRRLARHYLGNDREMFAELYSLAYSPTKKGAFAMGPIKAAKLFAKSLAKLRDEI